MPASNNIIENPPKALVFDVFGTCVDWRTTVVETLQVCARSKAAALDELPPALQTRITQLKDEDWEGFAQEWRASYGRFTANHDPEVDEWKDIDTHHHESLLQLLQDWDLAGLYSDAETLELSRIWHFLDPWPDSSRGLTKLRTRFVTSSLSNGNHGLLHDLRAHAQLGFTLIQSAEDWKAYKPHPSVYRGAAKRCLGGGGGGGGAGADVDMAQCAMVAAHLGDLQAARGVGMRTIYVERWQEEATGTPAYAAAKEWVDMWVSEADDGFVEVARRFGLE